MNSIFKGLILSCVIGFLVACSLEPLSKGRQVWIRIEEGGKHADVHLAPVALMSGSPTPAPSLVSGFDCLGVNVTGPGIADTSKNPEPNLGTIFDRLLRRESYCSYRGIVVGPIASNFSTPQEVAFVVPPGLRLIQLVGMKERNGSNSCQVEFNPTVPRAVDPSGRPLEGDVYELGRAVADLIQDQSITIQTDWNSLQAGERTFRIMDCNNGIAPTPLPSASPVMMLLNPTQMAGVGAVTNVAMSGHTCINGGGSIQCKGGNAAGQLGNGTVTNSTVFSPVLVSGTQVVVGGTYSCALLSGGTVQCWGDNSSGQLGNGTSTNSSVPTTVSSLSGVTQIAAGAEHACALLSGGTVSCWGNNVSGQLGDGTTLGRMAPVSVSGLSGATQIVAGSDFTCARLASSVACWGGNTFGQLGNGTLVSNPVPVTVTSLSGSMAALSAGGGHACAVASGVLKCWGKNMYGQLGNGSTTDSSVPVAVTGGISSPSSLQLGAEHSCALTTGPSIQCWGENSSGQLGSGTTTQSAIPVSVPVTASGVSALGGGGPMSYGTCMLGASSLHCWGANYYGQIVPP